MNKKFNMTTPAKPSRRHLIKEGITELEKLAMEIEAKTWHINGILFGEAAETEDRDNEQTPGFIGRLETHGNILQKTLRRVNGVLGNILEELD